MLQRRLCAASLVVTDLIHLAVVPEHLHEWPAAGWFFVGLAAVEAVLAAALLVRADSRLLLAGATVSVASAALWVVSRSVGLPIGPEAFSAEAITAPDLTATILETATAMLLVHLASRRSDAPVLAHR